MEFCKIDQHSSQQILAGSLVSSGKPTGQMEGEPSRSWIGFHSGSQAKHLINGGADQIDGAGDCGTDNIAVRLTVTAVAPDIKADNPVPLHVK